jgi:hypothetical protein
LRVAAREFEVDAASIGTLAAVGKLAFLSLTLRVEFNIGRYLHGVRPGMNSPYRDASPCSRGIPFTT